MRQNSTDFNFVRQALREAAKALGRTSPNPAVGALLALNGRVIARGHHSRAGSPHAEVECLRRVKGPIPRGAVLYVTLEPCATVGRTGACTSAIIDAGVQRVVVGATDPNPKHAGRGIKVLEKAGVEVSSGVLAVECALLNEAYNKWITTKQPFVITKCGMTLDGRLSLPPGDGRWITSAASRKHAHQLRARVDAILIGAETLRTDNPRLTVRGVRGANQPWRVVVSGSGHLPKTSHLFTDQHKERTIVYRGKNLKAVLRDLGKKEITSVLIEGGGQILGEALDKRLVDKVQLYLGPSFAGGPTIAFGGLGAGSTAEAARLERISYEQIGHDVCVTGYPKFDPI